MKICPLCGRETFKERIQHPPPMMTGETEDFCLHPSHIYDREFPPCEQRGVERIAALEAERDAAVERERHTRAVLGRMEDDYKHRIADGERKLELALAWDDESLPEDDAIKAVHPSRTGMHLTYAEAMRLVNACHSKGKLVDLVHWLLTQRRGER